MHKIKSASLLLGHVSGRLGSFMPRRRYLWLDYSICRYNISHRTIPTGTHTTAVQAGRAAGPLHYSARYKTTLGGWTRKLDPQNSFKNLAVLASLLATDRVWWTDTRRTKGCHRARLVAGTRLGFSDRDTFWILPTSCMSFRSSNKSPERQFRKFWALRGLKINNNVIIFCIPPKKSIKIPKKLLFSPSTMTIQSGNSRRDKTSPTYL